MYQPEVPTQVNPISSEPMPLSIKIIGWYYIIGGALYILLAPIVLILSGVKSGQIADLVGIPFSLGFSLGIIEPTVLLITILAIIFGIVLIFLGKGLLNRNKVSWLLVILIGILGSILTIWQLVFKGEITNLTNLAITVLVFWKLFEHKNIFSVKL